MRAEIAKADETIVAARRPVETYTAAPSTPALTEMAWTTGSAGIDNLIRLNGKRYGVDPYLIYCVIRQESGFRAGATSPVGAAGLMQLMPGTAARYGVSNAYDPAQSIRGGTRYLADLLRLFGGRVDLALAGYNAGEGAVMKYGRRVPPYAETQNYVRTIGARYAQSGVTLTGKTSERATKANRK
jgi:soluble lytic murein transglycosylase-like protein